MKLLASIIALMTIVLTSCSSSPQRPDWPDNEFEETEDYLYFNGVSDLHASEPSARRSALNNATQFAIRYLETKSMERDENFIRSNGLESAVVDGTNVEDTYIGFFARGSIRKQKALRWYKEREADAYGKMGYKVYVQTSVPKAEIEKAYDAAIEQSIADARRKQRESMDDEARQQWEQTEEYLRSYREQNENFFD